MPITLTFSCGGCEATAAGTAPLYCAANVVGRSHGMDRVRFTVDHPQKCAPEGWVAYDPYTSCTYCPGCWKVIECDHPDGSRVMRGGSEWDWETCTACGASRAVCGDPCRACQDGTGHDWIPEHLITAQGD